MADLVAEMRASGRLIDTDEGNVMLDGWFTPDELRALISNEPKADSLSCPTCKRPFETVGVKELVGMGYFSRDCDACRAGWPLQNGMHINPCEGQPNLRCLAQHRPDKEEEQRGPRTDCAACGGSGCDRCIPDEFS